MKTGSWKGGKTEMAGYNSWVRTAGGEKNSFLAKTLSKLRFFRFTQYNADAHNTHAHSPL
jgi:hypothetical protein